MKIYPENEVNPFSDEDNGFVEVRLLPSYPEFVSLKLQDEDLGVANVWLTPEEAVRIAEALLKKARKALEEED